MIKEIEVCLSQQYTESDIRRIVAGNPLFTLGQIGITTQNTCKQWS